MAEEQEANQLTLNIPKDLQKPDMVDENLSPIKFTEKSSKFLKPHLIDAEIQTDDVVFAD